MREFGAHGDGVSLLAKLFRVCVCVCVCVCAYIPYVHVYYSMYIGERIST